VGVFTRFGAKGIVMAKYREKPVIIDAFQWTGDGWQIEDPWWIVEAISDGYSQSK